MRRLFLLVDMDRIMGGNGSNLWCYFSQNYRKQAWTYPRTDGNMHTTKAKEDTTMKRAERNEYNYIRRYEKQFDLSYGTTLTIRTNGSAEYKRALHELYTGWGFHPASVRVDSRMYDDRERIIYIYGMTFDLNGEERPWTELYTDEERARFAAALD